VSWFSLVIGQNASRQLATSSENLVAIAQFLVALATSESQFRALHKSPGHAAHISASHNAFFSSHSEEKKTNFLDVDCGKKEIEMWCSVVCTVIDNNTHYHSGQTYFVVVVDSLSCASRVHNILTTVMTCIIVDKGTDHAKPHFHLLSRQEYNS